MKKFFIFLFLINISLSVNAQIITGEVKYNTKIAQEKAFQNSPKNYNLSNIKNHVKDNNNKQNSEYLLKGQTELNDRKLMKFSDGTYGIQFYNDPLFYWYYSPDGKLISFTKKDSEAYPTNITKYNSHGTVINIGYKVSQNESYIFSPSGNLIAHWLNGNCYDKYNNLIMTRKRIF